MSKLLKSIQRQINIDKEVVEVLPKSGIKQMKELKKNLENMLDKYNKLNTSIEKEMNRRYDRIVSISENEEIAKIKKSIMDLDNLGLSDDVPPSFEKMQLDKFLYNLNGYYKKDLKTINKEIIKCVKRFKEVGIPISAKKFNISEYVEEYMAVLLEEAGKGNINSERVKNTFDQVYWKCSDLIPHIIVNIRQIYNENEAEIDKFYKNKTTQILNSLNLTEEQVIQKKHELVRKLNDISKVDGKLILDSFFDNTYSITDFKDETYTAIYSRLISREIDSLSEIEKIDMDNNIENLNNNLTEYVNYLEFKFLIDEILKLREEKKRELEKETEEKNAKTSKKDKKNKSKSEYETIKSEIEKLTHEVNELNVSLNGGEKKKTGFFAKKKEEKPVKDTAKILERDNKILQIKELYPKLDNCRLKEMIVKNIDDTSKILDVLTFASYDYGFLARSIIKKIPDIPEKEIHLMIDRIRKFVRLYNCTVINNINITEKKDISIIIKDKYKLLGMTLTKENFSEANLEELMKDIKTVKVYNDIKKSNILLEDIRYVINAKEILKK